MMNHNVNCPCSRNFQIEYDEEPDLDENPNYLESICNGTFMSYQCPGCGKKHKPEYKITLVWKSKNLKLEVLPELDRGGFYIQKDKSKNKSKEKDLKKSNIPIETIIGYPEMADRISVIKDGLEPIVIETLKYYLLAKAEENFPDRDINAWYHGKGDFGIEFHLDGIRVNEVAVMRVPLEVYKKTYDDWQKNPKKEDFTHLRYLSYLSVQNIYKNT